MRGKVVSTVRCDVLIIDGLPRSETISCCGKTHTAFVAQNLSRQIIIILTEVENQASER